MTIFITTIDFKDGIILLHLNDGGYTQDDLRKFPRLFKASYNELSKYELCDDGKWIHW